MLLSGGAASLFAGFLLASWTMAGIVPPQVTPRSFVRDEPRRIAPDDGWREAGYDRIGLWEQPRIDRD